MAGSAYLKYEKESLINIIGEIRKGNVLPWDCVWEENEAFCPQNGITKKPYRGINQIMLQLLHNRQESDDPRYFTFLQIKAQGWHLKKGSRGKHIIFFKKEELKDKKEKLKDKNGNEIEVSFIKKKSVVFNAKDIEGILKYVPNVPFYGHEAHKVADWVLRNSGATIVYNNTVNNNYSLTRDVISLKEKKYFKSSGAYYAVAFHKLAHWSGHKDRLDRCRHISRAEEEMAAELSSYFTCMRLNCGYESQVSNVTSYLKSWYKTYAVGREALGKKEVIKTFFSAVKHTQKSSRFICKTLENRLEKKQEREQGFKI